MVRGSAFQVCLISLVVQDNCDISQARLAVLPHTTFLLLAVLQLYVLAPPSEHNLRLFSTWMEIRGTEHGLFLQDALEGLVKLQVRTLM